MKAIRSYLFATLAIIPIGGFYSWMGYDFHLPTFLYTAIGINVFNIVKSISDEI